MLSDLHHLCGGNSCGLEEEGLLPHARPSSQHTPVLLVHPLYLCTAAQFIEEKALVIAHNSNLRFFVHGERSFWKLEPYSMLLADNH